MSVRVKVDVPIREILKNHKLDGTAQLYFSTAVRRLCDPYVPMRVGMLKNTAEVFKDHIDYVQPYARRQYYENGGEGIRGKRWDERMKAARGPDLVRDMADYLGGKASW